MENVKDNEIDLGLALGIAIRRVESCSNNGAGANANSRSRIGIDTIVETRPLTELVWSRHKGLSIKCAGCNSCVADMKPCILSPAVVEVSPTQDHEKHVIENHSAEVCHSVKSTLAPLLGSNLCHADENVGEMKCVPSFKMENSNKGKEKVCMSGSKSILVDNNVAGTSGGPKNRRTADLLPLLATEPENIGLPLKVQDVRESACPLSDLQKEGSSYSAPTEKIEGTAENDVIVKDVLSENSRRCVEDLSRDEEGSMESCNSANLMSKGSKRLRFEQPLIIGSKRLKQSSQQYPVVKQDSSFMNWISNMVKGIRPYQEEEGHPTVDHDKTSNIENKRLGFQTVFKSANSQDAKGLEPKTQIENNSKASKEIILFGKTPVDDHLNQKTFRNLWITRLSPKPASTALTSNNSLELKATHDASVGSKQFMKPVVLTSVYDTDVVKDARPITTHSNITCAVCGKMGHELRDCLQTDENTNVFFKKKVSRLNEVPKQISQSSENNKLLKEDKILRIPKGMFDTIRRLRLSRTDILKWMNSRLPIANLDGYFLRLRLSKWEEKVGEAGYYVACIIDENPSKGTKKPIRVSVGGVQCLVESRYISNCDFLEDELVAWWQTTKTNGRGMMEENLTSKLEERKKLGF
uniref:uncharacterized protein LOC122601347 n=1 Tax=Erigeron canadensis TaxID=72917 RepID=UPI001CB8C8AD|nr:uncharacterized protein LOC122601347 [Erigeron canadensis]